jgi:hypothetical protein
MWPLYQLRVFLLAAYYDPTWLVSPFDLEKDQAHPFPFMHRQAEQEAESRRLAFEAARQALAASLTRLSDQHAKRCIDQQRRTLKLTFAMCLFTVAAVCVSRSLLRQSSVNAVRRIPALDALTVTNTPLNTNAAIYVAIVSSYDIALKVAARRKRCSVHVAANSELHGASSRTLSAGDVLSTPPVPLWR